MSKSDALYCTLSHPPQPSTSAVGPERELSLFTGPQDVVPSEEKVFEQMNGAVDFCFFLDHLKAINRYAIKQGNVAHGYFTYCQINKDRTSFILMEGVDVSGGGVEARSPREPCCKWKKIF